jgi:hypothetical protein
MAFTATSSSAVAGGMTIAELSDAHNLSVRCDTVDMEDDYLSLGRREFGLQTFQSARDS